MLVKHCLRKTRCMFYFLTRKSSFTPVSFSTSWDSSSERTVVPSRVLTQSPSPASQWNRLGPEMGDDHQICLFGVCLLMTKVPLSPSFRLSTPLADVKSKLSPIVSSSAPAAVSIASNVASATNWYSVSAISVLPDPDVTLKLRRTSRAAPEELPNASAVPMSFIRSCGKKERTWYDRIDKL